MKKYIIDTQGFETLAVKKLTHDQLMMIKGGGNNPPTPDGNNNPDGPPPQTPAPNNPGNQ